MRTSIISSPIPVTPVIAGGILYHPGTSTLPTIRTVPTIPIISGPIPIKPIIAGGRVYHTAKAPPLPPVTLFYENSELIDAFAADFVDDPFITARVVGPIEKARLERKEKMKGRLERKNRQLHGPSTPSRKAVKVSGPPRPRHKRGKMGFVDIDQESLADLADMWKLKLAAATFY